MAKVLVVDDDVSIRGFLTRMLSALGYEVVTACNGWKAIEVFSRDSRSIDLVITDLRMPGMDGYETIRRIRALDAGARIVCTSGNAFPPAGTAFLPKPFTLAELRDCVDFALARARRVA